MKTSNLKFFHFIFFLFAFTSLSAQTVLLWPNGAPGAKGTADVDKPSMQMFLAPASINTGTSVIVCPGGAYWMLESAKEGTDFVPFFNNLGVNVFVLKYRLNNWSYNGYTYPTQLNDIQRAIRTIRYNAIQWNLDPAKIGAMGFSAGAHLAANAGNIFDNGLATPVDSIDKKYCRPDFTVLAYPVITLTSPNGNATSRDMLLGRNASTTQINLESNELHVTSNTSPAFIVQGTNDAMVPAQNSTMMYNALVDKKVSAELHLFNNGAHGFGLAAADTVLGKWTMLLRNWMGAGGFLNKKVSASVLNVTSSALSMEAAANSTVKFDITSNISWNIASDQSWLTASINSGSNYGTITLTASANTSTVARTSTLTISGNGVNTKTILVTQKAPTTGLGVISLLNADIKLYPEPVTDKLTIVLANQLSQADFTIYTLKGTQVYKAKTINGTAQVNMSNYVSGGYIVKIVTGDQGVFTRQIIKQ